MHLKQDPSVAIRSDCAETPIAHFESFAGKRGWNASFREPIEQRAAYTLDEVIPLLRHAEAAANKGFWVALDDGEYTLLDRHLSRARNSALYLGFHWIESQVSGALDEAARSHPLGRSRVRLIVDRTGKATVEVHPLERNQERPLAVRFATRPIDERDPLLFHKTTARSRYDAELERCRPCDDVIFWNSRGEVTESTIANVVIFTEGKYWTPPREAGLLAGTLREELISKEELFERTITKRELVELASFALINSVRGWIQAELLRNGDSGINGGAALQHSHGDASFPILIGR